ncbi:hypothetical protein QTP88_021134 [Uroleucon formosanum]
MAVHGVEIQAAVDRLAKQLNINNFKASSRWLFRFRRRHNITNKKICGESLSADNEAVQPFRKKLNDILKAENILPSQLYNYDETGLYWRALPDSTQASKTDKNTPGRKISKDRVSALLCANVICACDYYIIIIIPADHYTGHHTTIVCRHPCESPQT